MKKTIIEIVSMMFLIFIIVFILTHSSNVSYVILSAFDLWKNNLFPSIFPMFVISEIFVAIGGARIFSNATKKLTKWLFLSKPCTSYVMIMGLLTGFPSSAKYIEQLYESGEIDDKDASKILNFTHFSNPLFIINTIASNFLMNKNLSYLILFSHYFSNIIIGVLTRKYNYVDTINITYKEKKSNNKKSFGYVLSNAIINSINTLLLILGTVTIFMILTNFLNSVVSFGDIGNAIFNGIIEMSQGLKYISVLNISLRLKTTLSVMIISFGGLSVHLQIMSILSDTKVKYLPFLLSRIFHLIISGTMCYILYPIFMK